MMAQVSVLRISFDELCQSVNGSEALIMELVENRIVVPLSGITSAEWIFNVSAVSIIKKALRLHYQLEIALTDIPLVLNLLEEIDGLKKENVLLRQRLGRFLVDSID